MEEKNSNDKGLITVQVIKHLPSGLGVQDGNGDYGIVHLHEISWDPEKTKIWKENYPIGWTGKAVPLPARRNSYQEFSLRLAERDPWDDLPKFVNHQSIYGTVVGIFEYGVFVEIALGITGLLHKTQIPKWVTAVLSDLFWQGDKVLVEVKDIDYASRQIHLCLASIPQEDLNDSLNQIGLDSSLIDMGNSNKLSVDGRSMSRYALKINEMLIAVTHYLDVDLVILFSMNTDQRQVSISKYAGKIEGINEAAISQLKYSPIQKVLEDNVIFIMDNSRSPRSQAELGQLIEFYPDMLTCIGVPVESDLATSMALFAFSKKSRQVTQEQVVYVQTIASKIGAFQECQNLLESTSLFQHYAMIGQLTSSVIHEINNLTSPLHYQIENMQAQLKRIMDKMVDGTVNQSSFASIVDTMNMSKMDINRITGLLRSFGRISARRREEILRIDEIVNEIINITKDICRRSKVQISFSPTEKIIVIKTLGAHLQQVILNVVLNALQQIIEMQRDGTGLIHIQIEDLLPNYDKPFYRILISDNGPGIHNMLWEKIFQAGYTTRRDGAGLGLFISRNLAEGMGGNIYVKTSSILYGTTFALELPYEQLDNQQHPRYF